MAKDLQLDFDRYVDGRNEVSPFRQTLRAMGITDQAPDREARDTERKLLLGEICDKLNRALAASHATKPASAPGDQAGDVPVLDIQTLLDADIDKLLKPLLREQGGNRIMSMLDIVTPGSTDGADIRKFLERHGVDLEDPNDLSYAESVLDEAIEFFDEVIIVKRQKEKKEVHKSLRDTGEIDGIYRIFQTAAGKHQRQLVPQACGILRIAAAIHFLNCDPYLVILPEAEKKLQRICDKYFKKKGGKFHFTTGKPGDVPLVIENCEIRTKTRRRRIAKLLHKPQNSAKEVIDHIGMRVTTKSAFEALQFLYLAFFKPDTAIFPGMTIDIAETRQLLLSETALIEALQSPRKARELVNKLSTPAVDHAEMITVGDEEGDRNQFSSKQYKAIQVTFSLPITTAQGQKLHFPVEVQIVDQASRITNEEQAPHPDYIKRQTEAVRARVERNNLLTEFEKAKRAGTLDDEQE